MGAESEGGHEVSYNDSSCCCLICKFVIYLYMNVEIVAFRLLKVMKSQLEIHRCASVICIMLMLVFVDVSY